MATQSSAKISEEEYLRLERAAKDKSEFAKGEIVPRPSVSFRHSALAVNWSAELENRLRSSRCYVFFHRTFG